MQNLFEIKKKSEVHHFNIVESGSEDDISKFCLNIFGFKTFSNPNYFYQKYDSFLVDDARNLIQKQSLKNKFGEIAIFVIEIGSINVQAQNSLLKIFEESAPYKYFFILLPQSNVLLPTLISRSAVYKIDRFNFCDNKIFPRLETIELMTLKERLRLVNDLISEYKKERILKSDLKKFVNVILIEFHKKTSTSKNIDEIKKLKQFNDLSVYFDQNGAHLKSLLEFILINI